MNRLQSIGKDIWLCEGGNVDFYGFAYSTRMIIVRLPDGKLWVWSPIALDDELRIEVEALGVMAHLVSPNKIHYLFLQVWGDAFRDALLWGPASTIAKCKGLNFESALSENAPKSWGDVIEIFHFTGSPAMDELVFFHAPSSTAILADLSENFSHEFVTEYWKGWQVWGAKFWGILEGKAPLEWRSSFFKKKAARAARDRLLARDPTQVIMAHGQWQHENGKAFLTRSLTWLGQS